MKTLWRGPEKDGITQSLLSRFLVCRERFRLLVVEGLKPVDRFNHRIEYGSMWHLCEEERAKNPKTWSLDPLTQYAQKLVQKYPESGEQIEHWYQVCKTQFSIYAKRPRKICKYLVQEEFFAVPYKLPSGLVVLLRGKWDGVVQRGKILSLVEHKTKGSINQEQIVRQLQFDLQTMLYAVCLEIAAKTDDRFPTSRVRNIHYNVVRRPLSGGKGSIRQHKPTKSNPRGETKEHFYGRVAEGIMEDPDYYFMSWDVALTKADIDAFRNQFLDPILESLCEWWDWVICVPDDPWRGGKNSQCHWRIPYGFWNILAEGGADDLDAYLDTGSKIGLEHTETLFPELEE